MANNKEVPTAPSGWFSDPSARHELCYWDGWTWTGHVVDAGAHSVDLLVPTAAATGGREDRVREQGTSTAATTTTVSAAVRARSGWRRVPVWAWLVIGLVILVAVFLLAPIVGVLALVVSITAVVSLSKKTPTWLRFRSRGAAVVALAVSAVTCWRLAGSVSAAILPSVGGETPIAATAKPSAPKATPTRADAPPTPMPTLTPTPATGAPGTALALLATLPVKGRAPKTGYSRAKFGPAWEDVDHNGCDKRIMYSHGTQPTRCRSELAMNGT